VESWIFSEILCET